MWLSHCHMAWPYIVISCLKNKRLMVETLEEEKKRYGPITI